MDVLLLVLVYDMQVVVRVTEVTQEMVSVEGDFRHLVHLFDVAVLMAEEAKDAVLAIVVVEEDTAVVMVEVEVEDWAAAPMRTMAPQAVHSIPAVERLREVQALLDM